MSEDKKSLDVFKNNIMQDLHNINYFITNLYTSISELEDNDLSDNQKKYFYSIYSYSSALSRDYIPDMLDDEARSLKAALKAANEKILELEKGIGEKVSCNEIFGFIKSEDNKIQELLKSHGLNIMLNIKAASYSINYNLVFKPIRETTSSYTTSLEEIELNKELNIKNKKNFMSKFDFIEYGKDLLLLSNEKNIAIIKSILECYNENIVINNIKFESKRDMDTLTLSEINFSIISDSVFMGKRI